MARLPSKILNKKESKAAELDREIEAAQKALDKLVAKRDKPKKAKIEEEAQIEQHHA